jgi:hypothetical protein
MSTKHKIIIALLSLGAIIIAAESGWLSVSGGGSGGASMGIHYKDIDLNSITAYSFLETSSGYRLCLSENCGEPLVMDVTIEIDSLETAGRSWTPLHKTLTTTYSGRALIVPDLMEIDYQGRLEDFTIFGLCSPHAAKRIMSQMAMENIRRALEQHFLSHQTACTAMCNQQAPIASPLLNPGLE